MTKRKEAANIWLLAWIWAAASSLTVIVLGLAVPAAVTIPFGMALAGVFAAVSASWVSNSYAGPGSRARLLSTAAVTEAVALVAAGLFYLAVALRIPLPALVLALIFSAAVALGALQASWRLRKPEPRVWPDIVIGFLLLAGGSAATFGGVYGLCGAAVSCHA